tara:strand:- start:6791 stop:7498 length:708 start_codon:yes stop_codon:yes gene_type:complete
MWKESSPAKQETERVFSNMSSEAWKKWVIEQRQEYSQRVKSVRPINERESSSWPTPTSRDWKDGGKVPPSRGADKVSRQTLPQRLAYIGQQDPTNPSSSGKSQESWATPNTMDSLPQKSEETLRRQAQTVRKGRKKPSNLREQVDPKALEIYKEESKQWPTARVSDVEGGRIKTEITDKGFRSRREKSDQWFGAKLRDAVETHEEQTSKRLNADWVEHLMGLPPQWTQMPTEWID